MICYQDRGWCELSDQCARKDCSRNFNTEHKAAAEQWWGNPNAPVQFQPMQGGTECKANGGFLGVE